MHAMTMITQCIIPGNVGAGEREGRVASSLVARRNYRYELPSGIRQVLNSVISLRWFLNNKSC